MAAAWVAAADGCSAPGSAQDDAVSRTAPATIVPTILSIDSPKPGCSADAAVESIVASRARAVSTRGPPADRETGAGIRQPFPAGGSAARVHSDTL
ncbi:hypothetical protein NicSoilB4_33580 [Arthrobacter sp. NicSoilB4]|nr:hypothetical protein NicSoilB4_33580 [Arthrobacter sp. NicSoilB4]